VKIAALYDIHGNLPALEAVLPEVEAEAPDVIVVGGDVGPGPLVGEVLDRLAELGDRARFVMGNGDRELVSAFDGEGYGRDTPWALTAFCAERLTTAHRDLLASFEPVVRLDSILFCHGSPRSDTEIITAVSPEERLAPILAGVAEAVVVCGHTHHQFDRHVHGKRLLNAGSVGMPYEDEPAAYWLLLGPEPELRRTGYDIDAAADRLRAAGFADLDEVMLHQSLYEPVGAAWVARHFEALATA
jgi:putative phosphoesterase